MMRPYIDPISVRPYKPQDRGYYFKFYNGIPVTLVRYTLEDNGFREAGERGQEWAVCWACSNVKSALYQGMGRFQKVNHFPKSTEITRKDHMYRHLARMREKHGEKHFPFLPTSFILPNELGRLQEEMVRKPSQKWIVKPASSSQGKGIFITQDVADIPPKEQMVASVYVDSPLLIDGYKFDIRIYVALTSVDPLRIYVYEEGLVRFATQKYQQHVSTKQAKYVHLTNYSLNKNNANFHQNTDAQVDDQGSKWSVSALRKRLKKMGLNDKLLFCKIEDLVIKTIISGEHVISNATDMFCPFPRYNCFELFGFDVLVDSHLEPWLLEVNLTPALACDSPLDQKIKANVVADLLSLAGVMSMDHR